MDQELANLTGIGQKTAESLKKAGLSTVRDLLWYLPRDYRDESRFTALKSAQLGHITARVRFSSIKARYARKGMHVTEAIASDSTGSLKVIWFKQPYRVKQLESSNEWFISGELKFQRGRVNIVSPMIEPADDEPLHTGRIVPIYREAAGLSSKQIRKFVKSALVANEVAETLPGWLIEKYNFVKFSTAMADIHFPVSQSALELAIRRLKFEELFRLVLASQLSRRQLLEVKAKPVPFRLELAKKFVSQLPYKLTNAQRKVTWQVYKDIEKSEPSNRLIEGDVGAGKTVVAAMVAVMVMESGGQVAFMAPTEILARQHAETLLKILSSVGLDDRVSLLVGSLSPKAKKLAQEAIKNGKVSLIVGTHALIEDAVEIPKLQLVIVDEQHRFGVQQRKKLQNKAQLTPHAIYLTATPIPRSLALTLYGELDVSVLDEKPLGRKNVLTSIVSPAVLNEVLRTIERELELGRQVFVVCPLISNEKNKNDLLAAENMHEYLRQKLIHTKVGLVHGIQKQAEKESIMAAVVSGTVDVLVATTVIEVGVDVPNASLMVVMGADKFGLAQLHQLRGRVGRAEHQSFCILVPSDSEQIPSRLQTMTTVYDGFKLAEFDLKSRGPGAIYGTLQHGALDLRIAQLTDTKLIILARQAAVDFIAREKISEWPQLGNSTNELRKIVKLN